MKKTKSKAGLPAGYTRATFIIPEELNEKIKAIAYWDRISIKDVIEDILLQYFKDKNIIPLPIEKKKISYIEVINDVERNIP
jgi:hypothetical protein